MEALSEAAPAQSGLAARVIASSRLRLLIVMLLLLTIPLLGYRYLSDLREFLVLGQKDALLLNARAVASVLNDRPGLFNTGGHTIEASDAPPTPQLRLAEPITVDGKADEWHDPRARYLGVSRSSESRVCHRDEPPLEIAYRFGNDGDSLAVLLDVVRPNNADSPWDGRDQLDIRLLRRDSTTPINARIDFLPSDTGPLWRISYEGDSSNFGTSIESWATATHRGYRVELKFNNRFDSNFAGLVFSQTFNGFERPISFRFIDQPPPVNRYLHSPQIKDILQGLNRKGTRVWIIDSEKRVRAVVGEIGGLFEPSTVQLEQKRTMTNRLTDWLSPWVDRLLGLGEESQVLVDLPAQISHRNEQIIDQVLLGEPLSDRRPSVDQRGEILMAAQPIWQDEQVLGAALVEQSSGDILNYHRRTLRSLGLLTVGVFLILALIVVGFTIRQTLRITRLRTLTEAAITNEGRILLDRIAAPDASRDEIGDLSRSINRMLRRLNQYHRYLEAMPDTLAHEVSNPLNVVQSSLHNLREAYPEISDSHYLERTEGGLRRLKGLLSRLTEAANLEDAIRADAMETVDLTELIPALGDGYRQAHPGLRVQVQVPAEPLPIRASVEHIAQMIDKLIDNAIDYHAEGTPIVLIAQKQAREAMIAVANDGPALPDGSSDRLFEPMVRFRTRQLGTSHLGLGLYVVRLIAQCHEGRVQARNRQDGNGVIISIWLPIRAE
ncbi:ATP-binding protein [Gammaproteobacteria bacterium]|nr:ATP-binding protein [Gammaproteobacteria bacterium]